jgi:hypothetical protein
MLEVAKIQDLPRDNASRLAIYDAIYEYTREADTPQITAEQLFDRVIGRLRVLVPRELHLAGDREYVTEKVDVCVQAGIVTNFDDGERHLALTGRPPLIRYPSGEIRDYSPGLELARERLDRDNARLRAAGFDARKFVPSIADNPNEAPFQELLASMREHGFMKQFPVVKHEDDAIVDGLARCRAAAVLQIDVEYLKYGSDKDRKAAHLRDTPLNRTLIAVQSNVGRLPTDVVDAVHKSVANVTLRAWDETAADLALTQEWRRSMPTEYSPWFEVKRLAYRVGDDPKVQVTADRKVMVRSLVEAGGLASYKIQTQLGAHVPFERARSAHSGGRKADFARVEDLVAGITAMQQERRAAKLKMDPEWEQIREWLVRTFKLTQG